MTRWMQILGTLLISAAVSAEPQPIPKNEKEPQPGVLRISGIEDNDRVLLDGELIGDGKRIARFGSKLLVNPGEYTVTIVSATANESCESQVSIKENRTSVVTCSSPTAEELIH